jgi:hypothetical protein
VVAVEQVGRPSRVIGRRDARIELELAQRRINAVYSSIVIDSQRLVVRETKVRIDEIRIQVAASREGLNLSRT